MPSTIIRQFSQKAFQSPAAVNGSKKSVVALYGYLFAGFFVPFVPPAVNSINPGARA